MREPERQHAPKGELDHQAGHRHAVRSVMSLRHFFSPSDEIRQEVTALVTLHGPEGAWLMAQERRRDAQENVGWLEPAELKRRVRYWNSVIGEIERQTRYCHQVE
ncbi:hypothetical protein [Aurantimonas aggregata]|nr:hypothetical protein [Aurantimonas aggregata]